MNSINLKAHFFVFLATILVAGSFIASEKLAGIINPFSLILLRFVASVLILAPFILFRKKYRINILKTMPRAMIISFFYAGYFVLMFEALDSTTALNTGTLYTLVPLLTALLCVLFFKDKITLTQWIVYIIGIIGTCGVVFKADISLLLSFSLNDGDLIFLIALFFMAFYSISMKVFYRNDDPILLVFCTLIGGAIWMAFILMFLDTPLQWELITNELIIYMGYIVIVTTLFTLYLYQKATIVLGPKSVMSYIYLNPAVVAIFIFIIDGIYISIPVVIAILISSSATIVLQINLSKERKN